MNKLNKGQKVDNQTILANNFYDKRRKVMDIVYQAREFFPNAPRVEVKIMTGTGGFGWVNSNNVIAIGEDVSEQSLTHVVLHELVHTWFKFKGHNEKCPLMKSKYTGDESEEKAWKTFKKYAKAA